MDTTWDSDERYFYTCRILTWPYQVLLYLNIQKLNFVTKVGVDFRENVGF